MDPTLPATHDQASLSGTTPEAATMSDTCLRWLGEPTTITRLAGVAKGCCGSGAENVEPPWAYSEHDFASPAASRGWAGPLAIPGPAGRTDDCGDLGITKVLRCPAPARVAPDQAER
jgi:hypothetical protein